MRLDLQSEPYSPLGNVTGRGVTRALGRPNLPLLAVLVRETVQNSLDARKPRSKEIEFSIDARSHDKATLRAFRQVFAAAKDNDTLPLSSLFTESTITTLTIGDTGTKGLDGPTRADKAFDESERNFVDFFRNVGEAPSTLGTGGTYGYGKAVLFLASRLSTVLVYTRTVCEGIPESRLMGMSLHEAKNARARVAGRLTGRHWWGKRARDGVVDPVRGDVADKLAAELGFRSFGVGSGSQVMILEPRFDGSDLRTEVEALNEHALLYAWPWTCGLGRSKAKLKLVSTVNNLELQTPAIEDYPALIEMREALKVATGQGEATAGAGLLTQHIESQRPAKRLGTISLRKFFRTERGSLPKAAAWAAGGISRHVAWMRAARLVVRYAEGPEPASPDIEYAGVFCVSSDDEVERAFADAEPPTHDDWHPDFVEDRRQQTLVRVGVRRIGEAVDQYIHPSRTNSVSSSGESAAWFSAGLAGLLPSVAGEGPGPRVRQTSTSRGSGGAGSRVAIPLEFTGQQIWTASEHGADVALRYRRTRGSESTTAVVEAHPAVLVGEGSDIETDAPALSERAVVLGWYTDAVEPISASGRLELEHFSDQEFWLRVRAPVDAAVTVRLALAVPE